MVNLGNTLRNAAWHTARVSTSAEVIGGAVMFAGGGPEEPIGSAGAAAMELGAYGNLTATAMDLTGSGLQWAGGAGPGNFISSSLSATVGFVVGGPAGVFPKSGNGALGRLLWGGNADVALNLGLLGEGSQPSPASCPTH